MNYEQFVRSQILFHEQMLADIKSGKLFWCGTCECWVPMDEKREDPWGGDWPVCIDCIADQGLNDNLLDPAEAEEQHLKDQGEQLQ